ncbi:hypothetical protein LINGRAHAP2_LOCUS3196 [Linum grandiflorum]
MFRRHYLIMLLVSWFMVFGHNLIAGLKLSAEEDKKLERQLKLINKPVVTTIQTKYGESYDCVDFYQQLAFDHPSLKKHKYKYQMSPYDQQNGTDPFGIWLNGKGCPSNTVPIKRIAKEDLIKINMASELAYNNSVNENPGVEVAVLRTTKRKKYYGAGMNACIYHPIVESKQYSSSRIIIQNGVDSIAVGWAVHPSLNGDYETRLFIYTITKHSHCYNTYCPGFIIMRSDVPLDQLLQPYTVMGGPIHERRLYIGKDTKSGDWSLVYGHDRIIIGKWPHKIFSNLADSANYVEWGGEVYSPPGTDPPPMGAGHLPSTVVHQNCYAKELTIVNEHHELDRNPPSCTPYHTSERYKLIDAGHVGQGFERIVFFGGNHYGWK